MFILVSAIAASLWHCLGMDLSDVPAKVVPTGCGEPTARDYADVIKQLL